MLCTNCGKEIPLGGNVCPFCGVDKSHDRTTQTNAQLAGCSVAIITIAIVALSGQNIVVGFIVALALMAIVQGCVLAYTKPPKQRIAPTIQRTAETSTGDTKKCPYCAESIKKEAVKCRFCGSDLNK